MIQEIRKVEMFCDFCGMRIEPDQYPRTGFGEEVEYGLCFYAQKKFARSDKNISEPLGEAIGHMCCDCRYRIIKMINLCKASNEKEVL